MEKSNVLEIEGKPGWRCGISAKIGEKLAGAQAGSG
jgi:hypothetical protein